MFFLNLSSTVYLRDWIAYFFQEQYAFVHEAILETILCGMNEVDSNKIQKETEKLGEVKASGMTGFEEKFKVFIHST